MQVEVSENWLTAGTVIGMLAFGAVAAFSKLYLKSREDERASVAASPAVVRDAVGAGLIDRSTADTLVSIAGDVKAIRSLSEERSAQASKTTLLDEAARVAREEAVRVGRERHHRDGDDD